MTGDSLGATVSASENPSRLDNVSPLLTIHGALQRLSVVNIIKPTVANSHMLSMVGADRTTVPWLLRSHLLGDPWQAGEMVRTLVTKANRPSNNGENIRAF